MSFDDAKDDPSNWQDKPFGYSSPLPEKGYLLTFPFAGYAIDKELGRFTARKCDDAAEVVKDIRSELDIAKAEYEDALAALSVFKTYFKLNLDDTIERAVLAQELLKVDFEHDMFQADSGVVTDRLELPALKAMQNLAAQAEKEVTKVLKESAATLWKGRADILEWLLEKDRKKQQVKKGKRADRQTEVDDLESALSQVSLADSASSESSISAEEEALSEKIKDKIDGLLEDEPSARKTIGCMQLFDPLEDFYYTKSGMRGIARSEDENKIVREDDLVNTAFMIALDVDFLFEAHSADVNHKWADRWAVGQYYACHVEPKIIAQFVENFVFTPTDKDSSLIDSMDDDEGIRWRTRLFDLTTVEPPEKYRKTKLKIWVSRKPCASCAAFISAVKDKLGLNIEAESTSDKACYESKNVSPTKQFKSWTELPKDVWPSDDEVLVTRVETTTMTTSIEKDMDNNVVGVVITEVCSTTTTEIEQTSAGQTTSEVVVSEVVETPTSTPPFTTKIYPIPFSLSSTKDKKPETTAKPKAELSSFASIDPTPISSSSSKEPIPETNPPVETLVTSTEVAKTAEASLDSLPSETAPVLPKTVIDTPTIHKTTANNSNHSQPPAPTEATEAPAAMNNSDRTTLNSSRVASLSDGPFELDGLMSSLGISDGSPGKPATEGVNVTTKEVTSPSGLFNLPAQTKKPEPSSAKLFDFGTPTPFSDAAETARKMQEANQARTSLFSHPAFGGQSTIDHKPAFSFGQPSTNAPVPPSAQSLFGSGKPSSTSAPAPSGPSAFSFGKPSVNSQAAASGISAFGFGKPSSAATPIPTGQPAFSFGKPSTTAAATPTPTGQPAFSFGKPSEAKPAATGQAAFGLGKPSTTQPPAPLGQPAFSFGKPSETKPSTAGQSAFTFGKPAAANPPPATTSPPLFSFGASAAAQPRAAPSVPAFSFGIPLDKPKTPPKSAFTPPPPPAVIPPKDVVFGAYAAGLSAAAVATATATATATAAALTAAEIQNKAREKDVNLDALMESFKSVDLDKAAQNGKEKEKMEGADIDALSSGMTRMGFGPLVIEKGDTINLFDLAKSSGVIYKDTGKAHDSVPDTASAPAAAARKPTAVQPENPAPAVDDDSSDDEGYCVICQSYGHPPEMHADYDSDDIREAEREEEEAEEALREMIEENNGQIERENEESDEIVREMLDEMDEAEEEAAKEEEEYNEHLEEMLRESEEQGRIEDELVDEAARELLEELEEQDEYEPYCNICGGNDHETCHREPESEEDDFEEYCTICDEPGHNAGDHYEEPTSPTSPPPASASDDEESEEDDFEEYCTRCDEHGHNVGDHEEEEPTSPTSATPASASDDEDEICEKCDARGHSSDNCTTFGRAPTPRTVTPRPAPQPETNAASFFAAPVVSGNVASVSSSRAVVPTASPPSPFSSVRSPGQSLFNRYGDQCFKCKERGHWASDCPGVGYSSPSPPSQALTTPHSVRSPSQSLMNQYGDTCFKCSQRGHWASDCPSGSQGRYGGGYGSPSRYGNCYSCGGAGHWSSECPY